jgi:neurotransmitter:Na+ symporter, NSS family
LPDLKDNSHSSINDSNSAPKKRESWNSYSGFIFASIGAAVGIGNIWRYPYIVGENGGGAFFLTYIIVIFTFGLSFMMLELVVGRYYRTSVIESMRKIQKKFRYIGIVLVGITFSILSYYLVILGWILSFFLLMIFGINLSFDEYANSLFPILSFIVISIINFVIIKADIRKGLERISKIAVLLLIGIIIPLTFIGISTPGAEKGIEFFLTPDFSKSLTPEVWSIAFGQAFFSLSIGMGVLLTYGSYLQEIKKPLLKSSIIIILADLSIAIIAGIMIFSWVFSHNLDPAQGIPLIFKVMPSIFFELEFLGIVVGSLFFFLLLLAGITSSLSMFQVPVSAIQDTLNYSKKKASYLILVLVIIAGLPSALSYSQINLSLNNIPFLDIVDAAFGTYGISISAAIFSVIVTWHIDKKKLIEQANLYSNKFMIPENIVHLVKIGLPILITLTIIVGIITK